MHVWVDGRLLDSPEQAAVSVIDHGFTVGDGVFEAVKVVDSTPFALGRHLDRLDASAAGLGLPLADRARVMEGVRAVLEAEPIELGRIRITHTAGPSPLGSGRGASTPTLVVAATSMAPYPASARVATVPWPRNERSAVAGLKTTSYAENVIALAEADKRGATEAIFANLAGNLCEGTGSNVFYAVDGELRTPTLASGCLAGITRQLILEWAGAVEVDEPIERVSVADEIFLASTTRDIQPVSHWDDRELIAPGPLTQAAMEAWRAHERAEFGWP